MALALSLPGANGTVVAKCNAFTNHGMKESSPSSLYPCPFIFFKAMISPILFCIKRTDECTLHGFDLPSVLLGFQTS